MPKVVPWPQFLLIFGFSDGRSDPNSELFEKIDPLWPLRPKCSVENAPIPILYSFAFHQNLPIWLSFTNQIQLFLKISLFHFKPFQASFSVSRCSARVESKCSWKVQTEPCQSDPCTCAGTCASTCASTCATTYASTCAGTCAGTYAGHPHFRVGVPPWLNDNFWGPGEDNRRDRSTIDDITRLVTPKGSADI